MTGMSLGSARRYHAVALFPVRLADCIYADDNTRNRPATGFLLPVIGVVPVPAINIGDISCVAVAARAGGTSRIVGMAPSGSPSGSVCSMNLVRAASRPVMDSALPAPVRRLLRPAVKNVELLRK